MSSSSALAFSEPRDYRGVFVYKNADGSIASAGAVSRIPSERYLPALYAAGVIVQSHSKLDTPSVLPHAHTTAYVTSL